MKDKRKKPIAVCFADIHYNNWANFNDKGQRLNHSSQAFRTIVDKAHEFEIPVLFSGDLVDNPKHVDNKVLLQIKKDLRYARSKSVKICAIGGNHDMCEKNFRDRESPSYIQSFHESFPVNFFNCDFKNVSFNGLNIMGIPYITGNKDYPEIVQEMRGLIDKNQINILMLHTDLPGAEEPDGRVIGTDENINGKLEKFFRGWDLVISGHIHKPQKLGKFIYMLGAPNQQRRSDASCKMGYWILYSDMSMEFIDLELPEFKYYKAGHNTDDWHYWIKLPDEAKTGEEAITGQFDVRANRENLAKRYLKTIGEKKKSRKNLLINLLNG